MIEYLKYFFNPTHLFSLRPPIMQNRALIISATVFGLGIILAIVFKLITEKTKDGLKIKAFRRLFHLLLTMGIIGYVYLFFAWQGIPLLSARFWLLLWLIIVLIWLGFILKYLFFAVPKLRKDIDRKRKFEKYLP